MKNDITSSNNSKKTVLSKNTSLPWAKPCGSIVTISPRWCLQNLLLVELSEDIGNQIKNRPMWRF